MYKSKAFSALIDMADILGNIQEKRYSVKAFTLYQTIPCLNNIVEKGKKCR